MRWLDSMFARPLLWALGLHLVVRASTLTWLGPVNIDECDWLVIARVMANGGLPYVDIFEKKPILSYLFYLPSGLAGWTFLPTQLLGLLWALATCLACGAAARAWTGRDRDGTAAILLCALAQCASIPSVNSETMLNLPAALALVAFARWTRERNPLFIFLAGLCVGLASNFRHQAGIELAALGGALLLDVFPNRRTSPLRFFGLVALLALGFLVPWALAVAWFRAHGHLDAFLEWNFRRNFAYSKSSDLLGALWRFPGGVILGVLLGAPLAWWLGRLELLKLRDELRAGAVDPMRALLVLAVLLTWIPVSMGGRFYEHYFLQFAPLVAVLAGPGFAALVDRLPSLPLRGRRVVAAVLAIPVLFWLGFEVERVVYRRHPLRQRSVEPAAGWVRAHSTPDDRIAVWGHWTPTYVLAQRLPGSRYQVATLVTGDLDPSQIPDDLDTSARVSGPDVRAFIDDLEKSRTRFFLDLAPANVHDWNRFPLTIAPELLAYLNQRYEKVANPGGVDVWQRK